MIKKNLELLGIRFKSQIEENDIPAQERRNSFPIYQKFKDCIIEVVENKYNIDL